MHVIRVCARLVGAVVIVCWGGVAAAQSAREGSGTSWLPDASPMYAVHVQRGAWMLMTHENAFLQFLHESGRRGDDDVGSINWFMGMAQRNVGRRRLGLRGMFSLEPWTIRGCGYPDLLASGEQCGGETIHDRQHPHDLAMEMSAEYDAPISGIPSRPTIISTVSVTGPFGPSTVTCCEGSAARRSRSRRSSSGSFQSIQ